MKKLALLLLLLPLSAFALPPTQAHVIKTQIIVPANSTSPEVFVPLSGNKLQSIKICTSFDSPVKNVQLKAELPGLWFGSVTNDCTTLDDVGSVVLPEDAELRLICRNFDPIKRTCRVKVVYYTKD